MQCCSVQRNFVHQRHSERVLCSGLTRHQVVASKSNNSSLHRTNNKCHCWYYELNGSEMSLYTKSSRINKNSIKIDFQKRRCRDSQNSPTFFTFLPRCVARIEMRSCKQGNVQSSGSRQSTIMPHTWVLMPFSKFPSPQQLL